MVVCVCNAIRESDVRTAARGGAMSACQAYRALGLQPKCGQCARFAREIIAEEAPPPDTLVMARRAA